MDDICWSTKFKPVTVQAYTESPGHKVPISTSPLEIFSLFFTSSLLQFLVLQTNQYALECMGGERYAQWTPVTLPELHAYMGFMILMGIVHLPSLCDYWKKDEIFHYSPVASWISRDRFFELHRYLHCVDNSNLPSPGDLAYNKLGKIQPVLDRLHEAFRSVYCPTKKRERGRSNDSLQRKEYTETVLTSQTGETWHKGLGPIRCPQWISFGV